jgi:hypothetical protein
MPQGLSHEMLARGILYAGEPEIQEMEVLTPGALCPGRLVIAETTEYQCTVAGVDSKLVLGVADVPSDKRVDYYYSPTAGGANTFNFTAADQIRVLRGDVVVRVVGLSGQTIVVGTRLVPAANGMVKAAAGTEADEIVGYSLEIKTAELAACCDWLLMKMTI